MHREHNAGYKHIFSHKSTFLELLRSFAKKEWTNLIKEEYLILVDKSYLLFLSQMRMVTVLFKVYT